MKAKRYKSTLHGEETGGASDNELPERWSVQRKTEVVLRLLRGELLEDVSRENQIPAHELESWKRGIKPRVDLRTVEHMPSTLP